MTLPPPSDRPQQWTQRPPQQQWSQQPAGPGPSWGHQPPLQTPSPAARASSRGRTTLIGSVVGILISALVVGALALAGAVHFGSDSSTTDTRAVDLPESLGGLTDVATTTRLNDSPGAAETRGRYQRNYELTAERCAAAFNGAGVGVRTYTNDALEFFLTVVAVRAGSPGLVNGPQADPADLAVVAQPNIFDLVVGR